MRVSSPLKAALQKMLLNILVNSLGRLIITKRDLDCANNSSNKLLLQLQTLVLQSYVALLRGCSCFRSVPAQAVLQALVIFFHH